MFAGLTTPLSCRGQGPLVSLKQRSVRLAALAWHIAGDTGRLQAVWVPGVCRIKSWIMDRWVGDSTSCDAFVYVLGNKGLSTFPMEIRFFV